MNFYKYSKPPNIELLKLLWSGWLDKNSKNKTSATFTGVYIINQDVDDANFKIGVAHGASTGIYNRISSQYKICWPFDDEFWLHFMILAPPGKPSKELEKLIIDSLDADPSKISYSSEWKMVATKAKMRSKLAKLLNANKNMWTYCISFGTNSWKICKNTGRNIRIKKDMTVSKTAKSRPRVINPRDYDAEKGIPNDLKDKAKYNPPL